MINAERKERRGFASMSPEKQREIASKGGRAAHQKGTAHEWTSDEARNAGRKGGQISRGGRGRLPEPTDFPAETSARRDRRVGYRVTIGRGLRGAGSGSFGGSAYVEESRSDRRRVDAGRRVQCRGPVVHGDDQHPDDDRDGTSTDATDGRRRRLATSDPSRDDDLHG